MIINEEKALISVIVPIYNVEKYLKKCIDTIISQTYRNLEIILVDDGSTDSSGTLCDEIQKSDDRIHVVHKDNGGLSSARNAGIDISNGEYIGFVDSDDYISPEMFQVLYENIIKSRADLSICGVYECFADTQPTRDDRHLYFECTNKEALDIIFDGKKASVAACCKLYKKSLFEELRFPFGKTSEDAYIIVDLLMKCKRVCITTDQYYYYVRRDNSITTENPSKKMFDAIDAYERNYKLVQNNFQGHEGIAKKRLYWSYFYVLDRIVCAEPEYSEKFKSEAYQIAKKLRRNFWNIYRTKISVKRKAMLIPLVFSTSAYARLARIFYRKQRKTYA